MKAMFAALCLLFAAGAVEAACLCANGQSCTCATGGCYCPGGQQGMLVSHPHGSLHQYLLQVQRSQVRSQPTQVYYYAAPPSQSCYWDGRRWVCGQQQRRRGLFGWFSH